ncbi:hypothetical protein [Flavilitoribacter nigricans]|uniref:Uncharacterized protein n=1 Tax=Flavilitoribacter nigricans (strain ATCC 23147 / DSM 23189 / NBRC 102662 / NCIMB 1420 / SS-2) TaxID=1122177 RepID=A0A2D0NAX0_FLAN2|nr:hypothetical protein [Flavilitoribacter nigricans]PHN05627.1 hypothetical protein CRP01_16705 [Flavilitoribacter nigricans DSM 23189 = NBRC 102662]
MQTYQQHTYGFWPYLALCLLFILPACRETESTESLPGRTKIFADFFIRYLAPEQQMRGQASFWEGVSWDVQDPLELSGIVSFENRKMEARRLPGDQIRYAETFKEAYEEGLAFRFRNTDGRYLQYEIKMTPVRDFFVKGKISKSEGATFVINGGIMSQEESLVFMFTDEAQQARAVVVEGPSSDIEITIPPEKLQGLTTGPGQLYLVKKQQRAESHPNLELTAAIEYYTGQREVTVEE